MIRWPNKIASGTIFNDIMSHEDWVPTLLSAVGRPTITDELKRVSPSMVVTITIISMATIFCRISPARLITARVTPFIIGAMTGCSPPCGWVIGRWFLLSSGPRNLMSGVNSLTPSEFQRYFICAVIPLSAPIKTRTPTTTGGCGLRYPGSGLRGCDYRAFMAS